MSGFERKSLLGAWCLLQWSRQIRQSPNLKYPFPLKTIRTQQFPRAIPQPRLAVPPRNLFRRA